MRVMPLRIAIFGQAPFGREVTEKLAEAGHEIVGVFVPPDSGRPDPLAVLAEERGWPLFRHRRFRKKGAAIDEIVQEYASLGAELNVLPFTTVILPPEITNHPEHGSLCFHPSLLPAFRGGAALSWQIILGAQESGVSVFHVTEGVDAGPLVIQRGGVAIEPTDTMASLYFDKLYPLGVEVMVEAVARVADGSAEYVPQREEGASEQGLIDDQAARVDWSRPAQEIERLIRGCDPSPGALAQIGGEAVRLFGGSLGSATADAATPGTILAVEGGLQIAAGEGVVAIQKIRRDGGKKLAAAESGLEPGERFD